MKGDEVEFCARVTRYTKGYRGYREEAMMENPICTDYRLSNPTKVKKILRDLTDVDDVLPLVALDYIPTEEIEP